MSIFDFFRKELTGYKRSGDRTHGRTKIVEGSDFTFLASVQPVDPSELVAIEDLLRKESGTVYKLITNYELESTTKNNISDIVEYSGKKYEVFRVKAWENNLLNHNVYLMQEIVL